MRKPYEILVVAHQIQSSSLWQGHCVSTCLNVNEVPERLQLA